MVPKGDETMCERLFLDAKIQDLRQSFDIGQLPDCPLIPEGETY